MKTLFDVTLSDARCGVFAANARATEIMASCTENGWFLNSELIILGLENGHAHKGSPCSPGLKPVFPKKSNLANPLFEIITVAIIWEDGFPSYESVDRRGSLLAILLAANVIAAYGQGYEMLSGHLPWGVLATVLALTLYFFVLFKASGYANGPRWRTAMTIILVFFALYFLITLLMLPDRSQDVYWNLHLTGGIFAYPSHPYTTTPADAPKEIWSVPLVPNVVICLGTVPLLSLFLPSLLGTPLAAIVALKKLFFAVSCFALVIFSKIIARMNIPTEKHPHYFKLIQWNPCLFQKIFIDLHADVFILASIVLSFYFFLHYEGWASILALVIGGFFNMCHGFLSRSHCS